MKFKNIIESKRTDATTNSQKLTGWTRLAQEFNSISTESYRTPNHLKTCWENIKRAKKKEVSNRKREIFMTGGGRLQPPPFDSSGNDVIEAVLGPALEGLSNEYDCDGPNYNEISKAETVQTDDDEQQIIEAFVILEEEKENVGESFLQDADGSNTTASNKAEEPDKTNSFQNKELWESWTPKTLKMPLAEPLRSNISGGGAEDKWIKRRRPKTDCSSDTLLKEKIELVRILKKNAEEEGNLRILILKEQLKQEQMRTAKLASSD